MFLTPDTIAFKSLMNRSQEVALLERFHQELDRPSLHGPRGHGNVAMRGYEDNRNEYAGFLKGLLEVQAVDARESDVEHQTARHVRPGSIPKLFGGAKDLCMKADRLQQVADGIADGRVIVNDENRGADFKHRTPSGESVECTAKRHPPSNCKPPIVCPRAP